MAQKRENDRMVRFSLLMFFCLNQFAFGTGKISRAEWINQTREYFALQFCSAQSQLVPRCYKVTQDICREQAVNKFNLCTQELRLPASINEGPYSVAVGAQIGRCVGRKFHKAYINRTKGIEKCSEQLWL